MGFAERTRSYDAAGNMTQSNNTIDGTVNYSYNPTNQFTGASSSNSQLNLSNTYDANGNRTNTGDVTGPDNELLSDGTYNYTYDANGNLVKQVSIADGSQTDYAYDYRNRLVQVTSINSSGLTRQVVNYSYDAFNRLVTRTLTPYTNGVARARSAATSSTTATTWC